MEMFDSDRLKSQLNYLYKSGLEQAEPHWNFGFPLLSAAFPTLKSGLWFLVANENVGKSMFMINVGLNVLENDPDAYWLDFSLDDNAEKRLANVIARYGDITINLVRQAGNASEESQAVRKSGFQNFIKNYSSRYHLVGVSSLQEDPIQSVEAITAVITEARDSLGPDKKLFVTIDGFHDILLEEYAEDTNAKLGKISSSLKTNANLTDSLHLISIHTPKNNRGRGLTGDALKGEGRIRYDAELITHLYSDVEANRGKADVYWLKEDEPGVLMPVHELDIIKNKAGDQKGVFFYRYWPAKCLDQEFEEEEQTLYRSYLFAK